MRKTLWILVGLAALLAACATPSTKRVEVNPALAAQEEKKQREVAFQSYMNDYKRVLATGYKIKRHSTPLCPEKIGFGTGFVLANKPSINEHFREAAEAIWSLREKPQIIQVFPGSGAARSGFQVSDVILGVNGEKSPTGNLAPKEILEQLINSWKEKKDIHLKILRSGQEQEISLQLDTICNFQINISGSDAINAFADGNQIVVTRGMLRFAQDDTELALIIGHELAHNVMGHIDSKTINAIPGFLLDLAVGFLGGINTQGLFSKLTGNAYSQAFEAEADYVGMYMMALAGLKFEGAPNFWRRMASIHPGSIQNNHMASHPATPERFLALEQTVAEIKGKLMRAEPLIPEKTDASFWDFLNDDEGQEEAYDPSN